MLYVMLLTICYNRDRMRQAVPVIVGATHSQLEVVKDDRGLFSTTDPPRTTLPPPFYIASKA